MDLGWTRERPCRDPGSSLEGPGIDPGWTIDGPGMDIAHLYITILYQKKHLIRCPWSYKHIFLFVCLVTKFFFKMHLLL